MLGETEGLSDADGLVLELIEAEIESDSLALTDGLSEYDSSCTAK